MVLHGDVLCTAVPEATWTVTARTRAPLEQLFAGNQAAGSVQLESF